MSEDQLHIVFAIFDGITQLDFTAPHQLLCRVPHAQCVVASARGGEVEAEGGLVFARTTRLADVQRCDVLCVPGGASVTAAMLDADFLPHVRRLAANARYVTSVCTGSLLLGAAGLLRGRRAACHWQWRHLLTEFGAVPDAARVVRDGNVLTGGGVTAGIDFALTLVAELTSKEFAQELQLRLEYAPAPPFDAGRPEIAPPTVLASLEQKMSVQMKDREKSLRAAASAIAAADATTALHSA